LIPPHVRTLEDYWVWLDGLVDQSGGWLEDNALFVYPIEPEDPFPDEDYVGLWVPPQEVIFGDGTRLQLKIVVDSELVSTEYSFHYRDTNGQLIWRKCNHVGHDVGLLHIHRRSDDPDRVDPYEEVDLAEVIEEVWEFMNDGSLP
jgi:hypothetical protein